MLNFEIDESKCIKCGLCASDCPVRVISFEKKLYPVHKTRKKKKNCIRCQHCLAVCPTGALSIFNITPDMCVPADRSATPDQVDALIRNRRSVRKFKQINVSPDKLEKTSQNSCECAHRQKNVRNTTINIIDDIDQMKIFVGKAISKLEELDKAGGLTGPHAFFSNLTRAYRMGTDAIFRGAPHIIVTSAPEDDPCPVADGIINLSYLELMASSMGIGVVWVGFAMHVLSLIPELKAELGIPDNHVLGYAMLIGEPAVKYHRGVIRDEIKVNRVRFTD